MEKFDNSNDFINNVLVGYGYDFQNDNIENLFDKSIQKNDNDYYDCVPEIIDLLQNFFVINEKD